MFLYHSLIDAGLMPQPQGALAKSFIKLAYKVGRPIPAKQEVLNLRHVAFCV